METSIRSVRKAMRKVAAERGLTPARWEREAGVASRVAGKFLDGTRGDIQLGSLIKLARAAGVPLRELLGI